MKAQFIWDNLTIIIIILVTLGIILLSFTMYTKCGITPKCIMSTFFGVTL